MRWIRSASVVTSNPPEVVLDEGGTRVIVGQGPENFGADLPRRRLPSGPLWMRFGVTPLGVAGLREAQGHLPPGAPRKLSGMEAGRAGCGPVARGVLGTEIPASVVGVTEVEGCATLDWPTAPRARNRTATDDRLPLGALGTVLASVASGCSGASGAVRLGLVLWASGATVGQDPRAPAGRASLPSHAAHRLPICGPRLICSGHDEGPGP